MRQLILIGLILLNYSACNKAENEENNVTDKEVKKEVNEALTTVKEYTEQERKAIIDEFRVKRDRTNSRILELKKELVEVQQDKRKELETTIENLERTQNDIEKRLKELDAAASEAYEDIKLGVDSALININVAIDKAKKDFDKTE